MPNTVSYEDGVPRLESSAAPPAAPSGRLSIDARA